VNDKKQWIDLEQLTERLCVITAEQLGLSLDKVTPQSRLIEDLNCDSLDMVELIMETEDEFGLTIPKTPSTPVGKLIFTRTPFRIRDLAEFAFLNQGTGSPARHVWGRPKAATPTEPEREFSQLGGRWSRDVGPVEILHEAINSDQPYPMFRRKSDGMVCVQIPSGETTIGSDLVDADEDEKPSHGVSLTSFVIDIEPVSVIAFCRFLNSLDATSQEVESLVGLAPDDARRVHMQFGFHADRWVPKEAARFQPVVMVSWFAANAYSLWANGCDWREYKTSGGFLPTEAQWEYAAQGAFSEPTLIQADQHQRGNVYADGVLPIANVHQHLGVSKFGLRHMSGTIWHWCSDWFSADFYCTPEASSADPINRQQTLIRSERGGSWVGPLKLCRPTYRRGRTPIARGRCLGFRCVRPLPDAIPSD
jgi:sulfatase modifying factor 1